METSSHQHIRAALADAVVAQDGIADCAILLRGDQWVAFVVADSAARVASLGADVRALVPDVSSLACVPVARVPYGPDGLLDESALEAMAIADSALAAAWETAIGDLPNVREVAALTAPFVPDVPALHLADLRPDWHRESGADTASLSAAGGPATAAANRSAKPAYVEGTPADVPADAPVTLADAIARAARTSHGVTYVRGDGHDEHQTYAELQQEARQILAGLRATGRPAGSKVILQLGDARDFLPVFWGCVFGGFVPAPIGIAPSYVQPNATLSKLSHAWELLDRPLIVTTEALAPAIRALAIAGDWEVVTVESLRAHTADDQVLLGGADRVALLLLTSGSTGAPKAVMQSHRALLSRSLASCSYDGFTSADISLNWFPLDHVGGLVMYHLRDVYAQCAQIQAPTSYVLEDPVRWLRLIDRYRATITWAPNFAFGLINAQESAIAATPLDLSSMRFILNGGEAIVAKTARRFLEVLTPYGLPPTAMRPAWGMSETCSGVTSSHGFTLATTRDEDSGVEVGPPLPGIAIRIVDGDDQVIAEERIGRLQVRGEPITSGYYKHDAANRESFTADGWFTTGDLGFLRNGRLTITGRQKDVIIINGINFYCQEIEAVVEEVPGVAVSFTAAVAARLAGSETDELAILFHATVPGVRTLTEIRRKVVEEIGVNPKYLVPVTKDAIPKTEIGKIQRAQIRQTLEAGGFEQELRRAEILLETANTLPDWFLEPTWMRRELAPAAARPGHAIVFADPTLGGPLAAALKRTGHRVVQVQSGARFAQVLPDVFEIRPQAVDDYVQLIETCEQTGVDAELVVQAWDVAPHGGGLPTAERLDAATKNGAASLIGLARAIASRHRVRVVVAGSHTQQVEARDKVACERVPVIALLQSLAAERPELACSHLDVPDSVGEAVQAICDEVSSRSDFEVARRGHTRWIRRLKAVDVRTPGAGPAFGSEGFYLVTGATGGVGQVLCEHALAHCGAKILAVGRTPLEGRPELAETIHTLSAGATGGAELRYVAVDVADEQAIRSAVATAAATWGSLKGVMHLAGTYHDRMIADETLESLAEVWTAKIAGTRALQGVLADAPDAWFAGFSSAVSYFGGAMIGAYAAANRFIEATAAVQAASGRRSLALGWSTWDQTGMSRGHAGGVALRARGFRDIAPHQALHSFDAMFERRQGAVLVGLDRTNHFIRRQLAAGPIATSKVTAFVVTDRPAEVAVAAASRAVADRFGTASACDLAFLRALPKHADGKIDRAALTASSHTVERVAPRTEAERRVAEAWHEVMGGISPGVYDNFFEQGGHSLLATRVLARLKARWGIDLPLRAIFEAPTVEKLALKCAADGPQPAADSGAIVKSRNTTPPLSFAQQRLWFLDQLEPGQISYNIPCVFKLRGRLDIAALERSLTALVERHEALRTTFAVKDGQAVQQVGAAFPVTLARVDLTSRSRQQRDGAARAAALDEAQRPFDLAKGPLFRATLVTLDDQTFWLLVTLHHIIADGWSLEILSRDVSALYQSFSQKRVPALAPLTIQYADYSQWQRDSLQGARLDRELAFWTTELAGVPTVLALPTDRPRPPIRSSRGRKYEFVLAPSLLAGIGPFTQGTSTTVFMALFAGFRAFLLAYTGQEDVAVGSPIAGRPQPELEPLIGFFANTLVLRTRAQARHSFRSILDEASRVSLDAFAHQDVPFEKLVEVLRVPRDRSRNPLFQVNFRVALTPVPPLKLPGIDVRPFELIDTATSKFDLALELSAAEGGASYFEYSVDLFEDETVRLMRYDFEQLLGAMLANPDRPLEQLDVFNEIAGRVRRAPAKKMTVSRRIRTGAQ